MPCKLFLGVIAPSNLFFIKLNTTPMQKILALLFATLILCTAKAQNNFKVIIKDKISNQPLKGVTITCNKLNAITNSVGFAELSDIKVGLQIITYSLKGYKTIKDSINFSSINTETKEVFMVVDEKEEEKEEEVIVQSTRTTRTIKNTPQRVETIDGEELDEKNNMRPANVSMLLHESTGLQVQQTSATSGNASIRVQGLDGRYTQLIKDGYPNFGNFASGLSILEIPPLDLKQVEVIKGPASTLYGGGAIAGVINFISKTPKDNFQGDFILNHSNIGQTNIGGYISQKKGKLGFALLGLLNFQKLYDVDKDDFSEVPKGDNFVINPRVYYYLNPSLTFMIGNSFSKANNTGGDLQVLKGNGNANHTYFEKNNTLRNTTTFEVDKKFKNKNSLKLKQSFSIFNRDIFIPNYTFKGLNTNSFTDLSFIFYNPKHTRIAGLNIIADNFKQKITNVLNAQTNTRGAYFQDTWDIADNLKIESGVRIDNVSYKNNNFNKNQTFVLPRISTLFKFSDKITSRIGAGLGYKTPSIFTEQTESNQYQNILALNNVKAEQSLGGTADINYKTYFTDDFSFSINQMFFYTKINNPLVLQNVSGNNFFTNAFKPIVSYGFETNVKFIYKEVLKLFVGYTFTNAKAGYLTGNQFLPLLPKNKLNLTMMYEKEDNFKFGLEGYFSDRQFLYNGNKTPAYWEFGFMAQKTIKKVSVFINFENFTDQRQSNYKAVANPPHNNPTFDDIWNHTEGFVFNGGIKIKI
jgi:outer membrane receptor for ferrienterochelin and colicins